MGLPISAPSSTIEGAEIYITCLVFELHSSTGLLFRANEGDGGVSPEVARVSDMASGVARVSDVSSGASHVSDVVSGRGPRRVYDRSIRDSGPYENVLTDTNSQQVQEAS